MRYEIVIDDDEPNESTPWQASVLKVGDPDTDHVVDLQAYGYGSTPAAAAHAAVESWKEKP